MKKRKYSSYKQVVYRHIKTTQELRLNQDCEYTRAKRKNIPNSYDDIVVKNKLYQSWKKIRKNQYRENSKEFSWYQIKIDRFDFRNLTKDCYRLGYYSKFFYDYKTKCYYFKWYGKNIL